MGDMVDAMANINAVLTEENPETGEVTQKEGGNVMKIMGKMMPMMQEARKMAIASGQKHYNDPEFSDGSKGQSCNSCHPDGGTSGGMVDTPMPLDDGNPAKLPVPTLYGVSAKFPKFKVPNRRVVVLETMANNCVRMFMGGSRQDHNEQSMVELIAYLGTLEDPNAASASAAE